ncbi:MAG: hypothetical protein QXD23_01385 [Candidatus Micrarchaeaceae archaeon]
MPIKKSTRKKNLFKELEFGKKGKTLEIFLLTEILIILIVGLIGYFRFPVYIPTHYFNGIPNSYGQSIFFPLTAVILSIAPIIVFLISKFRYKFLNKYPYFINLPVFYYYEICKLKREKRSYWVNKYFELVLGIGSSLGGLMLITIFDIYEGTVNYYFPPNISILMIIWILGTIALLYIYLKDLYKQILPKNSKTVIRTKKQSTN